MTPPWWRSPTHVRRQDLHHGRDRGLDGGHPGHRVSPHSHWTRGSVPDGQTGNRSADPGRVPGMGRMCRGLVLSASMAGRVRRASARWMLAFAVVACLLSSAAMSASMPMADGGGTTAPAAAIPVTGHAEMAMPNTATVVEVADTATAVTGSAATGMGCGLKHSLLPAGSQVGLHAAPTAMEPARVPASCAHVGATVAAGRSPPDLHALAVSRT